ncbi:MAG: CARDB domain-containing protein [Cyanobacteria bacterium P01_F01_bin.116]
MSQYQLPYRDILQKIVLLTARFTLILFIVVTLIELPSQPSALAQDETLSVPIRWCAVEGSPVVTDPDNSSNETVVFDTDRALWRRHERISNATFIPQANITLRSALWNIVQDQNLNFPIIPDQDFDDQDADSFNDVQGDVRDPSIDSTEWQDTYNACIEAWNGDDSDEGLGVGNIGIIAVNVRRIVDDSGNKSLAGWGQSPVLDNNGNIDLPARLMVEDNAFRLSFSDSSFSPSTPYDDVDWILGHETGHTLGLGHVCQSLSAPGSNTASGGQDDNMMYWLRYDEDSDQILDNFNLSESVDELVTGGSRDCSQNQEEVDQIEMLRASAQNIPGCKINGTNMDCTNLSDVKTDALKDVSSKPLDISMVYVSEFDNNTTAFTHELLGPFTFETFQPTNNALEYFVLADLDNNTATGGNPADLDIPTSFTGAELVTRVRVVRFFEGSLPPSNLVASVSLPPNLLAQADNLFPPLSVTGTVWRFEEGSFVEVDDPSIAASVVPISFIQDEFDGAEPTETEVRLADAVSIKFSNEVRGEADVPFRVQALSRGILDEDQEVVDLLDDGPEETGLKFRLESPTFPICSVNPNPAFRGNLATVDVTGLLPSSNIHVIFGDREVASDSTDATGETTTEFSIPVGARDGKHLVSVGVDGTAFTADCFVDIPPRQITRYEYAPKFICGIQKDAKNMQLAKGFYGTTINVHNPEESETVFFKKLALAIPPGKQRPGKVLPISEDKLGADQALAVDCDDIRNRLFDGEFPTSYIDGFLVIQSPRSLDVTGVYTTASLGYWGSKANKNSSIHVEQIRERRVKQAVEQPDLVVSAIGFPRVQCPGGGGTCVTTVDVKVSNIGTVDAGPFNTKVTLDPSQSVTFNQAFPDGLLAGITQTFTVTTSPGGNCFDPDCTICVTVDNENNVLESNEDNNKLCSTQAG